MARLFCSVGRFGSIVSPDGGVAASLLGAAVFGAVGANLSWTRTSRRLRERLWAGAAEHASWGVAIIRADDNTLLLVNPSFARMHRCKQDELVGKPFADLLAPEFRTELGIHCREASAKGHCTYESLHTQKDGNRFVALTDLASLKGIRDKLEYRAAIVINITQRKQTEELQMRTLAQMKQQVNQKTVALRAVAGQLLRAQDEGHRRIARELHDGVGQYLTALKIDLDVLSGLVPQSGSSVKTRRESLSECLQLVERCLNETRTLSHLLHPPLLDEAGFIAAAGWYIDGFSKRSGIHVDYTLPPTSLRLPNEAELALFRTLQESLTNVYRHSGSKTVDIRLAVTRDEVTLRVRDWGRGIDAEMLRNFREHGTGVGIGLTGIRERMIELDGKVDIQSHHPGGTVVTATIPLAIKGDTRGQPKDSKVIAA